MTPPCHSLPMPSASEPKPSAPAKGQMPWGPPPWPQPLPLSGPAPQAPCCPSEHACSHFGPVLHVEHSLFPDSRSGCFHNPLKSLLKCHLLHRCTLSFMLQTSMTPPPHTPLLSSAFSGFCHSIYYLPTYRLHLFHVSDLSPALPFLAHLNQRYISRIWLLVKMAA